MRSWRHACIVVSPTSRYKNRLGCSFQTYQGRSYRKILSTQAICELALLPAIVFAFLAKHMLIVCSAFKHFSRNAKFIVSDANSRCFQCNLDKTDAVLALTAFVALATCGVEKQERKGAQKRQRTALASGRITRWLVCACFVAPQSCSQVPKLRTERVEFFLLCKYYWRCREWEEVNLSLNVIRNCRIGTSL